jgi:hypothetical protein
MNKIYFNKNINDEKDAIYAHCETNMDRYEDARELQKTLQIK